VAFDLLLQTQTIIPSPFISDGCFVSLAQTTVQFSKSMLTLTDDLMRLYTMELETLIGDAMETVFRAQMQIFQAALRADKFQAEVRGCWA
jgi:hypothetical protein